VRKTGYIAQYSGKASLKVVSSEIEMEVDDLGSICRNPNSCHPKATGVQKYG
jgi:hypothetical protein